MRIALVSRELAPFAGGGIAAVVAAAARRLAEIAEVTVFSSAAYRDDARSAPFPLVWVPEPERSRQDGFLSAMHAYSARVHAALHEHYGEQGPDVIEFCDYLAEGFVTTQARRTSAPWLERTLVCVRLHTTAELCDVLDGHVGDDSATVAVHEAERYVLRHADRVIWPGGDVLGTYRRYYGELAADVRIPNAFPEGTPADAGSVPAPGEPLRLLYAGRLERRKGVQNLLRAVTALRRDDWRLTLLGGDTRTGSLGTSMRDQLELMAAEDPRVTFVEGVPGADVERHMRDAHIVVLPSLWECWPTVALEALRLDRPLLASPVGGLCELVQPGRSGWLIDAAGAEALQAGIERRLDDVEGVARLIAGGGPRAVWQELTDAGAFRRAYAELAAGAAPSRHAAAIAPRPLVSVVIPYYRLEAVVADALDSALGQTYPRVEVLLVVDGSLRHADGEVIERAERLGARVLVQPNSGLGAARNFGIAQSRGEYVLPLDADDMLAPGFVERCVGALEARADLAYATSWVRYAGPDGRHSEDERAFAPMGNWTRLIERNNVGGTCSAVMRRSIFDAGFRYSQDLTSYEDWLLYLELHRAGLTGDVVPERLLTCRVRGDSMTREIGALRLQRLAGEVRAHARERATRWEALAGPIR